MKKRYFIIIPIIIIALVALYLVGTGFTKQGDTYIADFSLSEDGTEMTITVGVSSSAGYVRKISESQQFGGKLYLDCYSAFGGFNGSWGAKSEYVIQLDKYTEMIGLFRGANCYQAVLQKDSSGTWKYVK